MKALESLNYRIKVILEEAKLYLENHPEDDKYFVKNIDDFMLLLRDIIENEKGHYIPNRVQIGQKSYVHEAFYNRINFATVTEEKIRIK